MGVVEGRGSLRPEVGSETPPPVSDRPVVVLEEVVRGSEREEVMVVENWLMATFNAAVIDGKPFIPIPNTGPIPVPEPD